MNQAPRTTNQHVTWMPLPPSFDICPPGLEYLTQIDWLLIHQKYEILELITSFETANKYEVRNRLGEMVYFATEENNFCVRNCLGSLRPFTMVISNQVGQQVIHLVRPFRCDGCCCPCCLQELEIQALPGLPIGYIQQLWDPCLPKFVIQNEAHKDVLKIFGPCITSACCGNVEFDVTALDEKTSVGKISKQWGGVLQEFFTDVDFLGISFPLDLDVKMKAVMLGAGFLLDFIFFEEGGLGYSRFSNADEQANIYIYYKDLPDEHGTISGSKLCGTAKMNQAPTAITAYGYNPNAMWMPLPPSFATCPPGLEYLSQIDWLLIHQKYEILELITSFETANKYEVRNRLGEMVYFATEENNFCVRNCLGSLRPFTMVISNHVGQQVIHLVRPYRCAGCCCPCCLQELEIQAPPGLPIGYIKQLWHPYLPKFVIQNEAHRDVLKIIGPCITSACCGDVVFEVMALDEQTSVGKIAKQWGGVLQEFFTDVDFLGISFPLDLDVKMKAVMLGAGFLLDFIFFESGAGARNERFTVWS